MKKTTTKKQDAVNELFNKGAIYLNDNFHRFSQVNKIKIALELVKKKMPSSFEGEVTHSVMFENFVSKSTPDRINKFINASNN